jgi:cell division protein FtsZ
MMPAAPAPEPVPAAETVAEPAAAAASDDWQAPVLTPPESAAQPLELELEVEPAPAEQNDEFVLDASRLHEEQAPAPVSRGPVSGDDFDFGGAEAAPASEAAAAPAPAAPRPPRVGGGATLFERMANLSRGGGRSTDEEDEDDDGPSISIPRFLGRQNNQ